MADFLKAIKSSLNNKGEGTFWKPKDGKNIIRVLPPKKGRTFPWELAVVHYGLPITPEGEAGVTCSRTNYRMEGGKLKGEGKCPICDLVFKLYKGSEDDIKLAKSISAKPMWHVNILDLTEKSTTDLDPKVYRFSKMVYGELEKCFEVSVDSKGKIVNQNDFDSYNEEELTPDVVDITSHTSGYKLLLTKTPKSANNEYVSYKLTRSLNPSQVIKTVAQKTKVENAMEDLTKFIKSADANLLTKNARRLKDEDVVDEDEFSEISQATDTNEFSEIETDIPLGRKEKDNIEFSELEDDHLLDPGESLTDEDLEVAEEPIKKAPATRRKSTTAKKETAKKEKVEPESLLSEDDLDDEFNTDFLEE